jgi:(2Fe-2S) ferredoxin
MEPFRLHVYVCTQEKPQGLPSCAVNGCAAVLDALRGEVVRAGLDDEVQVTTCGSLGLCTRGPNLVVYPEGVWYSGVRAEDVGEIVREHFRGGRPVARLLSGEKGALFAEIVENRRKAREAMKAARPA